MKANYEATISAACAMKITGIVVAAALVAADHVAEAATSYDILGITLGMSPEQVRQAISAKGADWKFDQIKSPSGGTDTITAARPDLRSPMNERIVVWFTGTDQQTWFVGRQIVFAEDQEPLVATVQQSVMEKYGAFSASQYENDLHDGIPGPRFFWSFDASGKLMKGPGLIAPNGCSSPYGQSVGGYEPIRPDAVISSDLKSPARIQPQCGVGVAVAINRDLRNKDLVSGLTAQIMDQHARFIDLKTMQERTSQRDQDERKKALEKAKNRAAPL